MTNLGPLPRAPRRFKRNIVEHGHHRACEYDTSFDAPCTCRERDEDDYQAACEARYDAWKAGDYAEDD